MKNNFITRYTCPSCLSNSALCPIYEKPLDQEPVLSYLQNFYNSQGMIEEDYLKDAKFTLIRCNSCSLIYQKDIPGDKLADRIYNHWIDTETILAKRKKTDGVDFYSSYAQEIMQIIDMLNTPPALLDIYDFGMGWGKWALMTKAFGCNAFGSDYSTDRIANATKNGITVIDFEQIEQYKFDFINTEQVFEHISNPLETLKKLKKSLKDNGIVKISVPTAPNIENRLKRMDWDAPKFTKYSLNPVSPLEHINYFKRESIIKMADLAGLKEVKVPLWTQYKYMTCWKGKSRIFRNLIQPMYINILKRKNYLLFVKT